MKQSLIGGVIGGLVVVLLIAGYGFLRSDGPAAADQPVQQYQPSQQNDWTVSPYRQYGQPLIPTPAPGRDRFQQDVTNCTDPSNPFTCRFP